jgi:hypothetical protein
MSKLSTINAAVVDVDEEEEEVNSFWDDVNDPDCGNVVVVVVDDDDDAPNV